MALSRIEGDQSVVTPERHRQIGELFHAAVGLAPEMRSAFLREACSGDEALRREVESLLACESSAIGFLSTPALAGVASEASFVGRHVGSYTIHAALGVGGMGEVYRARDTRLGREVAIKILPRLFTTDPDRRVRFDREARLLAALNHPHVGAIYGLEDLDGTPALILELVNGDTLAERIATGPIATEEALNIARQIADAVEAAHDIGIVHRDLKPANLKITPAGIVKVLDFGLAKALAGDATGRDLARLPTVTVGGTRDGIILGTVAYMSPEQARGRPIDKRTDIWAFGCVLFEMLTGRVAFAGETLSDTIAAIIDREPDWQALPPTTPGRVRDVLRRCLQKDPHRRLRDIGDARLDIDDAIAHPVLPRVENTAAGVVTRRRSRWMRALPIAATTVLTAVVSSFAWWNLRPATAQAPVVTRLDIVLPVGQQFTSIGTRVVAISADGKQVLYTADSGLYLRSMSELEARLVRGTESLQASYPVFSPDGRSIALHSNSDRTVKRIAVSGGAAATICEQVDLPYGMSWGANGILVGQTRKGIIRVRPDGGNPELLVSTKPGEIAHGPQILPGGEAVLFTLSTATGSEHWDNAQIVVQSLTSGKRTTLIEGGSDARYLPTGHLVYAIGGSLFAVPFDLKHLHVTGESVPVVEGVMRTPRSGTAQFSVSDTGTLIYQPGPAFASSNQLDLVLIDQRGGVAPLKIPRDAYESPRVSPDGKHVAVSIETNKEANIWIYALDGSGPMRRLTFGGRNRFPVWSADGQWMAFQSDREGDRGIFRQRADGSGAAERLTTADKGTSHIPESSSQTGQVFSFSVVTATDATLWIFSTADKKVTRYGKIQAFNALNSVFSPDGRWLAYTMRGLEGTAVYVQPFPYMDTRYQISKDDELGHHALWSPDGSQIFYFQGAGTLVAAKVTTSPVFTFGNPAPVPGGFVSNVSVTSPRNHDITPNGERMVMVLDASAHTRSETVATHQFEVVLNWFEELKARVPVR